jgi:hypothetical protein
LLLASKVKKINPIQKDAFDTLDFPPVGLFNAQEWWMW